MLFEYSIFFKSLPFETSVRETDRIQKGSVKLHKLVIDETYRIRTVKETHFDAFIKLLVKSTIVQIWFSSPALVCAALHEYDRAA